MNIEANKIAGAILGTALGVMTVSTISGVIYAPHHPEQPGFVIAVAETTDEAPAAAAAVPPIAARLQTASADAGMSDAKKCQACHTFEKGGPNKVGPNLWDVVGSPVIHHTDFNYSDAMETKGQDGMTWTFENLDQFLTAPKGFIPGTAMAFAGLKNPDERADVIAYLRTLSDSPVPLPPPPAPPPATAEAPAAAPAAGSAPAASAPATSAPPAAAAPAAPAPAPAAPPAGGAAQPH